MYSECAFAFILFFQRRSFCLGLLHRWKEQGPAVLTASPRERQPLTPL